LNLLVINCGSSSIKYSCFDVEGPVRIAQGVLECIGEGDSKLTYTSGADTREVVRPVADHADGLDLIADILTDAETGALSDLRELAAVGHRVVHGGEAFVESTQIDDEVIATIEGCSDLAPLHNPPNLQGIRAAMRLFGDAVQVAVFDTAFHQTMPPKAYLYAIRYEMYPEHGIRRYGFHGTSHRYVAIRVAELLGKPLEACNLITCHLGNGCSIAAVRDGKCVDTSMGLTPLEGLVMGTRSGDLDPAVFFCLMKRRGVSADTVIRELNRESGLLGISGVSNDMRTVHQAAEEGNERAALAIDIFAYRLKKYIGAYMAVLERTDCIVFTGGIGENAAFVRTAVLEGMNALGIQLDEKKNEHERGDRFITADSSPIRAAVVETDEEKMIALDTIAIARRAGKI